MKKVPIKDEMNEAHLRSAKLVVALSQKSRQNVYVHNLELLKITNSKLAIILKKEYDVIESFILPKLHLF